MEIQVRKGWSGPSSPEGHLARKTGPQIIGCFFLGQAMKANDLESRSVIALSRT